MWRDRIVVRIFVGLLAWVWWLSPVSRAQEPLWTRAGRLADPAIREASGLVASPTKPGRFWVAGDSGNPPVLHAIGPDGSRLGSVRLSVGNLDWEDLATDAHGRLYVGDIGNNGDRLPLRVIYRLDEPEPSLDPNAAPVQVAWATYYRFGPGGRFDAEALVIDGDDALLIAKRPFAGPDREAEIYRLPITSPAPLLRPAVPQLDGKLPRFVEPVTGADLSRASNLLAVCGLNVTRVYERAAEGRSWTLRAEVRHPETGDQIESIAWDGDDLLLVGEFGGVFRIRAEAWRSARPAEAAPR